MSLEPPTPPQPASTVDRPVEARHGRRIALTGLLLSLIATPVVVLVWGPHLPPGTFSGQAHDQRNTNVLLAGLATPVVVFVLVYFVYAAVVFRHRGDQLEDGPPLAGNTRIQATWIGATGLIVVLAAVFGTLGLFGSAAGAGGGQGPQPLAKPAGTVLPVQVIAQQWTFTYRYPTYGGVETPTLAIPAHTAVELHLTSLDVIHSFWAYQLGVKVDAVPGADNVAYVTARRVGQFDIRCSELCGLWHAQMTAHGQVLSSTDFATWIAQQQQREAPVQKQLPPYSTTYFPTPAGRAG